MVVSLAGERVSQIASTARTHNQLLSNERALLGRVTCDVPTSECACLTASQRERTMLGHPAIDAIDKL